jgi:hypothetical protein
MPHESVAGLNGKYRDSNNCLVSSFSDQVRKEWEFMSDSSDLKRKDGYPKKMG